jgi:hypothetical protein
MKKILTIAAIFLFVLVLTYMANHAGGDQPSGYSFSLKAQKVLACNDKEIVLVDPHYHSTRLDKGENWPDCSVFQPGQVDDFYLSRGAKTKFEKIEKTAWWRTAL